MIHLPNANNAVEALQLDLAELVGCMVSHEGREFQHVLQETDIFKFLVANQQRNCCIIHALLAGYNLGLKDGSR